MGIGHCYRTLLAICRPGEDRVRQIQRSELSQSSPASRPAATPARRVAVATPTRAAAYIPTEDEIDRLAKIGRLRRASWLI